MTITVFSLLTFYFLYNFTKTIIKVFSMKRMFVSIIIMLMTYSISNGQGNSYSFFVAGHTYGQPGVDNVGFHPPFKDKFPYIQSREKIKFGILTGDIVSPGPTSQDWDEIDSDISMLGLDVYFAVGNHDMENRPLFESRYGDTYYHFIFENDLFLILDPNIDNWNISGDQLIYMKDVVNSNYENVDNIFVFFHQLLWWDGDNIYSQISPNSLAGRADTINFWTEVEPFFRQKPNHIIFFAGDVGAASWSSDFMYDAYDNIELVASGMGENVGDNFVVTNVNLDKTIDYDLICLNDTELECFGDIKDYQLSLSISDTQQINWKLFPNPAKTKITIESNYLKDNSVLQVFNVNGRLLFESPLSSNVSQTFNTDNLVSGLYLVKINYGNTSSIKKLLIQ